ncbi:MAG TPA: PAS domain S-box protein [Steroidobacteraceae bacterium]|nr:PAS domain S-box protein [Steroidobacteraceae bacterium]
MTSLLTGFFAQQNFIPHGFCLAWDPALLGLHVISDSVIAIAYYSIPFALLYFISRRRDLAFRGIFALTGAFILACGTTHLMGVLTLWYPVYWLDGMIKLFTALISIFTAAAIWWAMPKALALPSTAQLEEANGQLEHEIGERERAQAALRNANAELEQRVAARTAELEAEVAQRRRTEETLRASEQRWRSMFEASAVGIALTDENRRFVAANEAFQNMIGYTAEELSHLGPVEITYEDDREATREMLDDMLSGRRADYHVEKRYRRKDGTVIWVRVSTARAPESGSRLHGIPTIIEDITERKRAEDALQEAHDALLRVTRLSTMGELSASIAHEVNQPLSAIVANGIACQRLLAAATPDLEEAKEAVGDIISDGRRASTVLARIRQLAKKSVPERVSVDINSAISEVLSLTRQELQRSGITARAELDPNLPSVLADRVQVQQVVLNLVMNGIEAMRGVIDRSRVLRVKSATVPPADVAVTVEDTGIGFDNNGSENIFETFFTTKEDGIGMGLSISRSIVQAHGGRLWASAGVPIGAVFSFTLPASAGAGT